MIPQLRLGGAIMMELAIVMVALSLILPYTINRWANISIGIITILFVVGGGSTYLHYLFIAAVEVICLLLIIWQAWQWTEQES